MSGVTEAVEWMRSRLEREGCLYQDDVIDYLVSGKRDDLLRENSEGTLVLGKSLLDSFRKLNDADVVWVKTGFYWRYRVAEDEPGREARG